jgi:hypothetical protein
VNGRRDPGLIQRSSTGTDTEPGADAQQANAAERKQAEAESAVGRVEARAALSLMARAFASPEHTPLYVVTFLTLVCLLIWIVVAVWGPNTPRVDNLIDGLGKAFTFFVGLFAGIAFRRDSGN